MVQTFDTIVFLIQQFMKKILLICLSLLLVGITVHISMPHYGGLLGVTYRIQWRSVSAYARTIRDPGACALIRGHWARSLREKLRDRCVSEYIQNTVQSKSDCHVNRLIADMSTLSHFWLRDEYRYACLLRHYQAMLGNTLTREWLPPVCLEVRDKLVVMEHYLQNIRLSRANNSLSNITPPLSENDISLVDQCEWFLDTPQIYSFLRDDAYTKKESDYIESQKQRVFRFE